MTAITNHDQSTCVAVRITFTGRVQGVGLRPAIARAADQLALGGFVINTSEGVEVHVEGPPPGVKRFERTLPTIVPGGAVVSGSQSRSAVVQGFDRFEIRRPANSPAECATTAPAVRVPPDVAVCETCLADVRDATQRRHAYALTSCTSCGPRYSIIDRMPYERADTTMVSFPLCAPCRNEYTDPDNRRFHAQTNACPTCGPQVWLRDAENRVVADHTDAVRAAAAAVRDGRIVALRGIGGYQLLVDATSEQAVTRLRKRKRRFGKPLAMMVASLHEAARFAVLEPGELTELSQPAGPIVIVRQRADARLAQSVSRGLGTLGLMLPTTPLHGLLCDAAPCPLVCTSANAEGEPLEYDRRTAIQSLHGIADLWLEHDRPIRRPVDDSVVRMMAGRPVTLRLARGLAPWPLDLQTEQPHLALGGHQKASIAMSTGSQAVLGPHIGDLDSLAAGRRYLDHVTELARLYGVAPMQLVADLHPDYFTTRWSEQRGLPVVGVQHHHAHIVSAMLEHRWLDREVLGVSFDGTGLGTDGHVWGGEFLVSRASDFRRVAHLRPFAVVGGDRAAREPWRIAMSLVHNAAGRSAAEQLEFESASAGSLLSIIESSRLTTITTSAGRLFDGVAALTLGIEYCPCEGDAAMRLEAACDPATQGGYDLPIRSGKPMQLDWRPMVRQLLADRRQGASPNAMAMRFHRGLADAIVALSRRFAALPVVLGGGVFQNRVLVELLADRFAQTRQPLGLPGRIPPNDGGLAAGQLAVAAHRRTTRCA